MQKCCFSTFYKKFDVNNDNAFEFYAIYRQKIVVNTHDNT